MACAGLLSQHDESMDGEDAVAASDSAAVESAAIS